MNLGFLYNFPWFRAQRSYDWGPILKSSRVLVEQGRHNTHFDTKKWGSSLLSLFPWANNARDSVLGRTTIWFGVHRSNDSGQVLKSSSALVEKDHQNALFDIKIWGYSLISFVPWANNARDTILPQTTINRKLKRNVKSYRAIENRGRETPLRFRPYVCKVPWHTGVRAFLSQLFPRYGHYCGPNWSSGKDNGSLIWDKRPIDWLDFCCYCHDIGYDTHNQADLLKADLAFLECLERPNMVTKGDAHIAALYRTMCITGLKKLLIPYRQQLIQLQSNSYQPAIQFGWLSNVKWLNWNLQRSEQQHPKV